ncbi:recombinase family protein [Nonomuraea sp. NEAU-L178]|nr:recombinase family protein [Nonomuraea aurantiaca]
MVFLAGELAPRGINLHILTGICAGIHRPAWPGMADKMLFLVSATAAEMERDLISERTQEGLDTARAAGRARRERGQARHALTSGWGRPPACERKRGTPMDGDIDRVAIAFLRKLRPEVQGYFPNSEEFRSLPDADRNRLYEYDAEPAEVERQRARRR